MGYVMASDESRPWLRYTQAELEAVMAAHEAAGSAAEGPEESPISNIRRVADWELQERTMADAYAPRDPIEYIVQDIYPTPSVSCLVSPSGCFKTALLMDLAVCLCQGEAWLKVPMAGEGRTFATKPTSVVWLNADNPTPTMLERFEAVGKSHKVPPDAPLSFISFPEPHLIAHRPGSMAHLIDWVKRRGARFVVIDNLNTVRGDIDENSADMAQVITPFRHLSEECNAAVVLVHHTNKAGDYRGSTAILNLIDFSLIVNREGLANEVTVKPGKMRNAPILPFGARFEWTNKPNGELDRYRFWGQRVSYEPGSLSELEQAIIDFLEENPGANQTQIVGAETVDLSCFGRAKIRQGLKQLKSSGKIRELSGPRNALIYELT